MNKADNSAGRTASSAVHVWSFLFSSMPNRQAGSRRFSRNIKRAVVFQPDVSPLSCGVASGSFESRAAKSKMRATALDAASHMACSIACGHHATCILPYVQRGAQCLCHVARVLLRRVFTSLLEREICRAAPTRARPLAAPCIRRTARTTVVSSLCGETSAQRKSSSRVLSRQSDASHCTSRILPLNTAIARSRVAYVDTVAAIRRLQPTAFSLQRDVGAAHVVFDARQGYRKREK
jgi:hypothetical protein